MARTRILYTLVLGIPIGAVPDSDVSTAISDLDERLTRIAGGITRFTGTGTWRPESDLGDSIGSIECDLAVSYVISLMPDAEERRFAEIRAAVAAVAHTHGIPIDWVHVSRVLSEERIFRVSDAVETANADVGADASSLREGATG